MTTGFSRWILGFCLLAACSGEEAANSEPPSAIDFSAIDASVDPCQSFYDFACGGWKRAHPLRADASSWRRADDAFYTMVPALRGIVLEDAAGRRAPDDPQAELIGTYYNACMRAPLDRSSRANVGRVLSEIHETATVNALMTEVGKLRARGSISFLLIGIDVDPESPDRYVIVVDDRGWELPEREDYLDPAREARRSAYRAHIRALSALFPGVSIDVEAVMEVETALATASLPEDQRTDPRKLHNRRSLAELSSLAPHVPWEILLNGIGFDGSKPFEVTVPAYVEAVDALLEKAPLSTLQHYVAWQFMQDQARFLDDEVLKTDFSFWGPTFGGVSAPPPREWTCYLDTLDALDMAVAEPFLKRYFPESTRELARTQLSATRAALARRLQTASWLDDSTRREALAKLAALKEKVGYPDEWPPPIDVRFIAGNYLENARRLREWWLKSAAVALEQPVDHDEWPVSPVVVNAFFRAQSNQVVFPAGILRAPLFDERFSVIDNLGALGTVMGHELTHGFDATGRHYDSNGVLRDFWTPEAAAAFEARSQCLVEQYSAFEVLPGHNVNGTLTLGENLADLGGVLLAHDVFTERGSTEPARNGFSAEQQFFLAFAQVYCENRTPESGLQQLALDSHAPSLARINATLANVPEFAAAFQCPSNSAMVNPNACSVW